MIDIKNKMRRFKDDCETILSDNALLLVIA